MRCFPMPPEHPKPNEPHYFSFETLELTAVLLGTGAFWYAASTVTSLFLS